LNPPTTILRKSGSHAQHHQSPEAICHSMKAPSRLLLLPERQGGAAENMAVDFLLLQRFPADALACFRHYSWRRTAFTFGYSQKHADAVQSVSPEAEICRRPSGGGLVEHTDDWTYAFVVARAHDLWKLPAPQSYRALHQALCDALSAQGRQAALQNAEDALDPPVGICFARAEPDDVILLPSRLKVAGAALKRNKHGLLFQGSISRRPLGKLDWERFQTDFTQLLAGSFHLTPEPAGFPEWDPEEESALIDQFSSEEWNQRR